MTSDIRRVAEMMDTKVILEKANGDRSEISTGAPSESVMKLATQHGIQEIIGECGGSLSCATCHVYVDQAWADRLPPPTDDELAMLDGVLNRKENSRLSCQLVVTPELDGIVIHLPVAQY